MARIRSGAGGRADIKKIFKKLTEQGIALAMDHVEKLGHGAAASITDPETGKHSSAFVRRTSETTSLIVTSGSPAFANELEKRLGVRNEEAAMALTNECPRVYLAHASEDHDTMARPLAQRMLADGIDVWLDGWEIGTGDSLRQKMEAGLGACTHFVVLLTPNSLGKAWVETEIDVGFIRAVEGQSRFMGIRVGVKVDQLSQFLKTRRCPSINLNDEGEVAGLISDIHGISRKPPRGSLPTYVQTRPPGLTTWAPAAVAVAGYLVTNSKNAQTVLDPQTTFTQVVEATGLPMEDVRLGVLDLEDAGLIERSKSLSSDRFWPKIGLFVEFDKHFLGFDNHEDAVAIANRLISESITTIKIADLAIHFPNWSPRRINSALHILEDARHIQVFHTLGQGPWSMLQLTVTDRTRRFARDHG